MICLVRFHDLSSHRAFHTTLSIAVIRCNDTKINFIHYQAIAIILFVLSLGQSEF